MIRADEAPAETEAREMGAAIIETVYQLRPNDTGTHYHGAAGEHPIPPYWLEREWLRKAMKEAMRRIRRLEEEAMRP